mmetsp:Transcript_139233/g.445032  ORF Transcript_139233/g.445032 Transcript_139233/m.445032 type:complete len:227 (+) Transcript_139233:412-1092(+)
MGMPPSLFGPCFLSSASKPRTSAMALALAARSCFLLGPFLRTLALAVLAARLLAFALLGRLRGFSGTSFRAAATPEAPADLGRAGFLVATAAFGRLTIADRPPEVPGRILSGSLSTPWPFPGSDTCPEPRPRLLRRAAPATTASACWGRTKPVGGPDGGRIGSTGQSSGRGKTKATAPMVASRWPTPGGRFPIFSRCRSFSSAICVSASPGRCRRRSPKTSAIWAA